MIATLYEPFKHWSERGSVYILSDLHFDDEDCKLMSPDWITPQEQIAIINRRVMKNDTFICLGDVGRPEYIKDIKAGRKILLLGNHDAKGAYKDCFDEIYTGPLFIAEKILLSHEPVYGIPWCLNIHGHDHSNMEPYKDGCKHINLAANVCRYTPINLGKIIKDGVLADIPTIHRVTIDKATGLSTEGTEISSGMRHREYYQYLELEDGTEIKYSSLKYSGVYFQCTTPDKSQPTGYKHAVTCWPDCIEPMRFFDVEGYSKEELDALRVHINMVGSDVVNMLQKEAKELELATLASLRMNSILLTLDAQQAGGLVAAYIKGERETSVCKVKISLTPRGEEILLYKENDSNELLFSYFYRTPNAFVVSPGRSKDRFFIQNDGDEAIWIELFDERIRLQPGERKLIRKEGGIDNGI